MNGLSDILILDVILLVLASFFGLTGFFKVLIVEIIYTFMWIANHL